MKLNPFALFYKLRSSAVNNIKAEGVLEALRERKVVTIEEHFELEAWAIRQGMAMARQGKERIQAIELNELSAQVNEIIRKEGF